MRVDGPIEAWPHFRPERSHRPSPSMRVDGPIEALCLNCLDPKPYWGLRRCESTAPLKQTVDHDSAERIHASPSMRVDGPIEAKCPRPGSRRSQDVSVDASRRPH